MLGNRRNSLHRLFTCAPISCEDFSDEWGFMEELFLKLFYSKNGALAFLRRQPLLVLTSCFLNVGGFDC